MLPTTAETVLAETGAQKINNSTVFQSLWSGYGQIVRLELSGGTNASVILMLRWYLSISNCQTRAIIRVAGTQDYLIKER